MSNEIIVLADTVFGEFHRIQASWFLHQNSLSVLQQNNLAETIEKLDLRDPFCRIHGILLEDILLGISRLTDNQSEKLSIFSLYRKANIEHGPSAPETAKRASDLYKTILNSDALKRIRNFRDGYLAHRLTGETPDYAAIRTDTETTMNNVKQLLSAIHILMGGNGELDQRLHTDTSLARAKNFWGIFTDGLHTRCDSNL